MTAGRRLTRRRRWIWLLGSAVLLSACWDRTEINERSNVLAIGYDACGANEKCTIAVSRQIAIPGRIPLGGNKTGSTESTVEVLKTDGFRETDAAEKAQMQLNRPISYGHMRVWVLGEELARRGVTPYLDEVRRLAETRRQKWVVVSEGEAEAVIRAQPSLHQVPALFLSDMLDEAQRAGRIPATTEVFFDRQFIRSGEDPVAPLIRMKDPNRPLLAGLAVFRGGAMAGTLSPAETAIFMTLLQSGQGGELLHVELSEGGWAVLSVYSRQVRREARQVGGNYLVALRVELECELLNLHSKSGWNRQMRTETELLASQQVKERAEALIERLQHELGADSLGIVAWLRSKRLVPALTPERSRSLFSEVGVQVQASVKVRRTGLSTE